jgi:hypothetical protein
VFIVWGKKIVRRRAGFVADFCPICRAKRAFEMIRVGRAGHVYYLSLGEGDLVGYERKCLDCRTAYQAEWKNYASVQKSSLPLDELTARTFPDFDWAMRGRLELEDRVNRAPSSFSADDRQALVRAPFLLLSPKVEQRFAQVRIDKETGFAILGALALLFILPGVLAHVAPDSQELALLVALGLGVLLVGWQGLGAGRRFMRREIVPLLARSLQPLRPRETELRTLLADLRKQRHKLGRKLHLADLLTHLAGLPPLVASKAEPARQSF